MLGDSWWDFSELFSTCTATLRLALGTQGHFAQ